MERGSFGLRPIVLSALLGLAPMGLAACGGGGGGGGGSPTEPTPRITFSPSGQAGSESVLLAQGAASTGSRLVLTVEAREITDLYGVAFDLLYPSAQLRYDGSSEGELLARDGATTSLQVAETAAGRLVVGLTRLGPVAGISGSGVLLELELAAVASGNGTFAFEENRAFDHTGAEKAGVAWIAGTVEVVR